MSVLFINKLRTERLYNLLRVTQLVCGKRDQSRALNSRVHSCRDSPRLTLSLSDSFQSYNLHLSV